MMMGEQVREFVEAQVRCVNGGLIVMVSLSVESYGRPFKAHFQILA